MSDAAPGRRPSRWWSIGGAVVGVLALGWVLGRADYARLSEVVAGADGGFLLLLSLAIAGEQLVRAWKWRQLLIVIRPIHTLRLFGAIMAGYLANFLVPLGVSPLVRSWLVARLEALSVSAVLATVAIDRLVDGVVFTGFVAVTLMIAAFPDPSGGIRLGLGIGGAGSLALFVFLLLALVHYKRRGLAVGGWATWVIDRLPSRFAGTAGRLAASFAEGVVWPRELGRSLGILSASLLIKLIATSHFLWAGLAFGVLLGAADYLFLVVFLGFLIILTRLARIPGGFFLGAIFALDLLGVAEEQALAMVLAVQFATMLTVTGVGALALWRNGVALNELRPARGKTVAER